MSKPETTKCDDAKVMPESMKLRLEAERRKKEVRRLQGIIIETIGEVLRIEARAAQLESRGALKEEHCKLCGGPCLRRPRHTDPLGAW